MLENLWYWLSGHPLESATFALAAVTVAMAYGTWKLVGETRKSMQRPFIVGLMKWTIVPFEKDLPWYIKVHEKREYRWQKQDVNQVIQQHIGVLYFHAPFRMSDGWLYAPPSLNLKVPGEQEYVAYFREKNRALRKSMDKYDRGRQNLSSLLWQLTEVLQTSGIKERVIEALTAAGDDLKSSLSLSDKQLSDFLEEAPHYCLCLSFCKLLMDSPSYKEWGNREGGQGAVWKFWKERQEKLMEGISSQPRLAELTQKIVERSKIQAKQLKDIQKRLQKIKKRHLDEHYMRPDEFLDRIY